MTKISAYYANTAYDSTKPNNLPPIDNSKFGAATKAFRRDPISIPRGIQAGEFLQYTDLRFLLALNGEIPSATKEFETLNVQEEYTWESPRNPKVLVKTLTVVAAIFSFCALVAVLIAIFTEGFKEALALDSIIVPAVPFGVYLLGKLVVHFNLVKDKHNIILNRRTGLITTTHKGKRLSIPFAEFDPYTTYRVNPTGSHDNHLHLGHRFSEASALFYADYAEPAGVYSAWELWQQYMDISKPLPDIPDFEAFRHKDPVTAEYDKKHKRPKDYWKNMDYKKASDMQDSAINASEAYPWGATRKQALASGWQPSGFGQGDWLKQ